jgi:glycerol-3-phosphate dehydrogenase
VTTTRPVSRSRDYHLNRAASSTEWDLIIIGGGATGVGTAVDAVLRGHSVLLLEAYDFGKGTSSRSTKLIHGGVRYLEQFQFGMVRDSLRERSLLLKNAPKLVHEMRFVIPCPSRWDMAFYRAGLALYDLLALGGPTKRSRFVSRRTLCESFPLIPEEKFQGGVVYSDAQFDDCKLLMSLLCQGVDQGLVALNYAAVVGLKKDAQGHTTTAIFEDKIAGRRYEVRAKGIINAAGAFADHILSLDDPQTSKSIAASQGVHLVLPKEFFPSSDAIIVPKTSDGRVLFIIPWKHHVLVGTTDTPIDQVSIEPVPFAQEIRFLLDTMAEYSTKPPSIHDCKSVFVGIRPLVNRAGKNHTKGLSRDHRIAISPSRLLTITGGKWTTYRKMAEDCVDSATKVFALKPFPCETAHRPIPDDSLPEDTDLSDQILHAVQWEFAQTIEDVLARRTRWLFTDAYKTRELAPTVAAILARELGWSKEETNRQLEEFERLSSQYLPSSYAPKPS